MPHPFFDRLPPMGLVRVAGAWVFALLLGSGAWAQDAATLTQITQSWIDSSLRGGAQQLPLRMEVEVGELDARLRLAPCARVEPYLPAGSRLWGRTRLGLRCTEGATRWNVFLPVTVKAFGPAWVLTGNVSSGAVLTQADATEAEIDWAAEASSVVADPSLWVGQVAARPLQAGQALRQSMVRAPKLFQAGAQVRVSAQGVGYAVSAGGQALSAGSVGQTVRVRMDNGKVISGVVDENGTIAVNL
ncbi:MAG: flagellar basal body P-ring formation protein FlgA [Simplicispira suum]|uniref:flagellar basal body P-ring formation chaperone FlgA n=1 Tax=Simplicispira suum TaxID=2109915 RepID=UPI001C6B8258|nr:flagellar basal body P-ring formation protein FlgA [Simplicispira suum]